VTKLSSVRGEVYIGPVEYVPPDGSMIDPANAKFWASWQADDAPNVLEEIELESAEAAIAWGRGRSETVLIRLGGRDDTYFTAGVVPAEDDDGPVPAWPPAGPPPGGWWKPPTCPTLDEVRDVAAQLAAGTLSPHDAAGWAMDRIGPAIEASASDELLEALSALVPTAEFRMDPEAR
jgi:hypothetical protein